MRHGTRTAVARSLPAPCWVLAVEVGFEPTEGLPPHTLSRRAPSATRRLHRRRAYLTGPARAGPPCPAATSGVPALAGVPELLEEVAQQRAALGRQHAADDLDIRSEPAVMQRVPQ